MSETSSSKYGLFLNAATFYKNVCLKDSYYFSNEKIVFITAVLFEIVAWWETFHVHLSQASVKQKPVESHVN